MASYYCFILHFIANKVDIFSYAYCLFLILHLLCFVHIIKAHFSISVLDLFLICLLELFIYLLYIANVFLHVPLKYPFIVF